MKRFISILCVIALLAGALATTAVAAETTTTTLFSGEYVSTGWSVSNQINTTVWGGSFDATQISEGDYFYVTYIGQEGQVALAFNAPGWAQPDAASTVAYGDGYLTTYTYDAIVSAYGSDFSGLGALNVCSPEGTVITGLYWVSAEEETVPDETVPDETVPDETVPEETTAVETTPEEDAAYALPEGAQALTETPFECTAAWSLDAVVYTNVWGGSFAVSNFKPGFSLHIAYTGEQGQVAAALNGSTWANINPSSTAAHGDGYLATYSYDALVAAYGEDLSSVGAIQAGGQSLPMTINGIYWSYTEPVEEEPEEVVSLTGVLIGDGVNVRTGPGMGYDVITSYKLGREVEIFEVVVAGDQQWGRMEQGWICLDYVSLDGDPTTVTSPIPYYAKKLWTGSYECGTWDCNHAVYTTNWGGSFNPRLLTEGSYIMVTYTGSVGDLWLCLNGNGWYEPTPDNVVAHEDGYLATYTYENLAGYYGEDFSTLGAIHVGAKEDLPKTITGIYFVPANPPSDIPDTGDSFPMASLVVAMAALMGVGVLIKRRED